MKKYLEDLKQELIKRKLTSEEIDEIIQDHKEMISNAIDEGLSEDEIMKKFGQPSQVASELADFNDKEPALQESTDEYQCFKTFEVLEDTFSAHVNLISEDITYQVGSDEKIKVFYKGKGKVEQYEISYEKNEFRLSAPKKLGFNFSFSKENGIDFLVELPREVILNVLKQVTISSDSELKNIKANDLIINTTSGDVTVLSCKIGKMKLHSVNGDAKFKDSSFDDVVISQVSGDVTMENSNIEKDYRGNTVSGDIELEDVTCVNFESSAVSGDVNGKNFYPQRIIFKSISGDLNIKNSEKKYIEIVKKSSLSGDISIS